MATLEDSRAICVVMEAEASCNELNNEQEVITGINNYRHKWGTEQQVAA